MAATGSRSANEEAHFQRIARLVIIGGTTLLREIFDSRFPPSYLSEKLQNPDTVKGLRGAHLSESQWKCLYPTPGVCGKSADFDISLLLILLRIMCSITPPATGWDARPVYTDHSLAADLARVDFYRNFLYDHVNQMTDDEFFSLCEEISDSFLRIAAQISPEKKTQWQKVIHGFLKDPVIVEKGTVQVLLRRYENETEVMKELTSELTTSTKVFSLKDLFQEQAQRIKDLFREELKSKAQGVQEVKHLGLEGVERELDGTTPKAKAPVRKKVKIKDPPKDVLQSEESLTSSAGCSGVGGGQIKLLSFPFF